MAHKGASQLIHNDKNKFNYLKKTGIQDSQYGLCRPYLYVTYQRQYFKINDVRVSIDNNIAYKLLCGVR